MKKLKIELLYNNVHFLFIFVILLILSFKYLYILPFLIFYTVFLIKKTKLYKFFLILFIVVMCSYQQYYFINIDVSNIKGIVIECDSEKAVIRSNFNKIMVYHNKELSLGDYGVFSLTKVDYDTELFSYSDYLLDQNIVLLCKLNSFEYDDNYFVIGKIKDFFISELENHPSKYNNYLKTLLFADKSMEEDIKSKTIDLGISHLLAVSGMHISVLVLVVEYILKKFFYFEKYIDFGICIFLVMYLFITNFELTVLRASLMVLLSKIFKHKKTMFSSLDILSIIGIFVLIIHPRYFNLLSFQLSFLVSFLIIIYANNIKVESKVLKTFFITLIAFIATLPIVINTNYSINLLSIFVGPIYVLFFELVLYPVSLIMLIIPKSHLVFDIFFNIFELSLSYLEQIKSLEIVIGSISLIEILLYFVILFFLLRSFEIKKYRTHFTFVYLTFLCLLYSKPYYNPFSVVSIYNVGQGDTFLISLPFGKGNILIDCYNNALDYLKKDGVKDLDIIIITHGHSDHMNALEEVISYYPEATIYSSRFDDTILLYELKTVYNINLVSSGDVIFLKGITLNILGPMKKYENENDNSLVIQTVIDEKIYLFTGDIEKSAEDDLIAKYGIYLKSDVLKVSHHGSITSSSKEFLKYVNPDYYLVSVKKNNIYGFPNNQFILNSRNLYRTDIDGTIKFYSRKKSFYIRKKLLLW